MKSMIVIALALTSTVSFSAVNNTKACASLKGKELAACQAKKEKTAAVAQAPAVETKEVKKDAPVAAVKKDAPVVTAKNVKAATSTTTTPAKK